MWAGRQAFGWLPHGYAPGLMVTNRYRPSASVTHRPTPVKFGSTGAGCWSTTWWYRPAALACQISSSVSGTGRPSLSSTRPVTMIRSPSGCPACWVVRSASAGATRPAPSSGPVISVSRCRISTGGWCGARSRVDR